MLMEHELPYVQQSPGDCPHSRFSAYRSTPHKGSKSRSSQSSTSKDNSSVGEDEFLNVTDGSRGARDQAIVAGDDVYKSEEDNTGRIDVGSSNEISVQSVDSEITGQSFEAIEQASRDAFDFGTATVNESIQGMEQATRDAIDSNVAVTGDAFDFADENAYQAYQFSDRALSEVGESNDTLSDTLNNAFQFAETSQRAANDLSRVTNEVISSKSSDADSAVSATLQKNILIGITLIGLVVAFK
jgi:hypothetical protein